MRIHDLVLAVMSAVDQDVFTEDIANILYLISRENKEIFLGPKHKIRVNFLGLKIPLIERAVYYLVLAGYLIDDIFGGFKISDSGRDYINRQMLQDQLIAQVSTATAQLISKYSLKEIRKRAVLSFSNDKG